MTALPDGWRLTPLGAIADTALGKMLDKGKSRGLPRVPYLRNVNVQWGRIDTHDLLEMELGDDERERFGVRRGDLLVCEGGEVGRAAIWDCDTEFVAYQKALHRVRPHEGVDARYLRYALENAARSGVLAPFTTGSTIAHLPQQNLRRVPLAVAPLVEQRRIVEVLDEHLSCLDAARGSLDMQLRRLEILRLSRTQRIRERIIRDGAAHRTIRDIAETALGKMLDAKRTTGTPTPYLRNTNVRWGHIDNTDVREVALTEDERRRFALRPGDLLVCEGGEPGRCAVWSGSEPLMTYQKALHRIRVTVDIIVPEFLAVMLEYVVRSGQADQLFTGTTIKHLPQEKLRQIEIPVPALGVQREAVAELREFDGSVHRLRSELVSASRRAEALRRSLLVAAFSGRLTGRSHDREHVEELVEMGA